MFGTVVNVLAIIAGSCIGLIFRGGIPMGYQQTVIQAIGLAVAIIGISGALKSQDILVVIFSLAIGSIIGELLRIETRLNQLGNWLERRFSKAGGGIARGFVTASGLTGNHQTLFAKSVLDGISSIIFASSFGAGVLLSALSVGVYQGLLTLSAVLIKPFLIPSVVDQMSAVGGILIMAIGINLLDIKKINVGNMLPAIFMPLAYYMIRQLAAL